MRDYDDRLGTKDEVDRQTADARDGVDNSEKKAVNMTEDVETAARVEKDVGSSLADTQDAVMSHLRAAHHRAQDNYHEATDRLDDAQNKTRDYGDRLKDGADVDDASRERAAEGADKVKARETADIVHKVAEIFAESARFLEKNAQDLKRIADQSEDKQRELDHRVARAEG